MEMRQHKINDRKASRELERGNMEYELRDTITYKMEKISKDCLPQTTGAAGGTES